MRWTRILPLALVVLLTGVAHAAEPLPASRAFLRVELDQVVQFIWASPLPEHVFMTDTSDPTAPHLYEGPPPVELSLRRGSYWIWSYDARTVVFAWTEE